MGNAIEMKGLSREVLVYAGEEGANIQMLLVHPFDKSDFEFHIVQGKGVCRDAYVLRCLLDSPYRGNAKALGGFMIVGTDKELEGLYAEAMGTDPKRDALEEANAKIAELEAKIEAKGEAQTSAKVPQAPKAK